MEGTKGQNWNAREQLRAILNSRTETVQCCSKCNQITLEVRDNQQEQDVFKAAANVTELLDVSGSGETARICTGGRKISHLLKTHYCNEVNKHRRSS